MLHGQILMSYILWMKFVFKIFSKFESDNELETRCLIGNLEDVGFQIQKFGTNQMYMLQSMGLGE